MSNQNQNNNSQTNLKKREIEYTSDHEPSVIKEILKDFYSIANNYVDINMIQALNFDNLIDLINSITNNKYIFIKKSDIIRAIIRISINKNLYIVGCGLLELITNENYGFLRSYAYNYSQSNDDIFIPSYVIQKYRLRYADEVKFLIKKDDDNIEKRVAIDEVLQVNGINANSTQIIKRKLFSDMEPIYPNAQYKLADKNFKDNISLRIMDLFIPVGHGQRLLIIAPPKSGKTTIFQNMASSFAQDPNTKVILLLIDERPEEVTDLKQNIKNIYKRFHSDFNETSYRHTYMSELCIEHAKRMCELGFKVSIFIDSLTRIARAYNCVGSNSNKVMSGGIDLLSLQKAKKLFGVARNTKHGSITIIATCLINTGSKMDEVIYEEFKGTSNSDIFLDRNTAERGIFPAIDMMKSSTRKHELLLTEEIIHKINKIRNSISKTRINAIELIIEKMKKNKDEKDFLLCIS